ncbi:SseB protein [Secundilactobacillus pentosiphilus]|uniref:SseB protein n=1 Tax=Secundilactobacillus pentosiphilus TaxID=1714682 RepID=A0A1Z5IL64_9LACO|nr:enhanced serine sensitivity protein SseB C-terminal domain-containing protein [Secundilactobacillus pentosiphilus]GAX02503.1 SseB protein [Secundilactobacillus pentosiphilus]
MEESKSADIVDPEQQDSESGGGSIMPFRVTGFNHYLQQYMSHPMDSTLESQFAAALLTMRFLVPVQTGKRSATAKQPKPSLTMSVAVTTYLADGQQYIPVFTDQVKMKQFLDGAPHLDAFRSFEFTSNELMEEADRLEIAGVLINPGYQSFPLSHDYWNYIHQVVPVGLPETDNESPFKIRMIDPAPKKLQDAIARELKHVHKVKRAWLVESKVKGESQFDYTVVVDYNDQSNDFQSKVARRIAKAAHRYLPHGADILVGTLGDPIGQAVQQEVDPFYTQKHWFS